MQCNLVRLDTGGVLDPEFGVGGRVEWKGPFDDQAPRVCALALQPDGKIVVVSLGSVTRYLDNGTVDPAFGVGGITTGIPGEAIAVQSNGKIVVVGGAGDSWTTGFALSATRHQWSLGLGIRQCWDHNDVDPRHWRRHIAGNSARRADRGGRLGGIHHPGGRRVAKPGRGGGSGSFGD